jgi:orotate phosphoribosyltransferase
MAKPKKDAHGSKSQAIRDYLKVNKKAKAAEVVAGLAAQGITVTPAAVYNLKARKSMGKRRSKARTGGQTVTLSITHLLAAKKLVDSVGGFAEARDAIDALAKLV